MFTRDYIMMIEETNLLHVALKQTGPFILKLKK